MMPRRTRTRINSTPVQLRNLPLNAWRTHLYPNQPHLVQAYAMEPHLEGPPAFIPHTAAWSHPAAGLNAVASSRRNLADLQAAALQRVAAGLAVTDAHLAAIATAQLPYTALKMQLQLPPTPTNVMPRLSRDTYQGMPVSLPQYRQVTHQPAAYMRTDGTLAVPTLGVDVMSGAKRIAYALRGK